jgi:O-antigen/teichoic acid export membrane protein
MSVAGIQPAPADGGAFADRVRSAVAWRWGTQAVGQVITWGTTIMVVRLLDPADYGLYALTQVVISAFNFLNGYSFATSLIHAREVDDRRLGQVLGMLILANGALAGLQLLIAPLAADYYNQPMVADMLRVQALVFLTTPLVALPSAMLARGLRFRSQGLVTLGGAVIGGVTALVMALAGYGVWALVWAPIAGFGSRGIGLTIAAGGLVRPIFDFRGCREIMGFGLALTLCQLFWVVQSQADIFIAGRHLDVHDVGLYSEALFLALIFTGRFLPPLNDVAFPAYAELVKRGEPIGSAFVAGTRMTMLVTAPAYIGLSLTAGPLVETVFGPKWLEMAPLLAGLALAMPAMALQIVCSPATNALGRPSIYLATSICGAVIMPACFLIGVHTGAAGLVAAWQIGAPLLLAVTLALTLPIIKVRLFDLMRALVPAAVGCALMAAIVSVVDQALPPIPAVLHLALLSVVGAAAYAGALLLLWPSLVRQTWDMVVRRRPPTAAG